MASITSRLATASAWITGAKFVSNALGALSTIVLARLLAPEDFGIVALASSFIAIAASVTELSLGEALINVRDPTHEHFHSVWSLSALRSAALGIVLAVLARPVAHLSGDMRLENVLYVLCFGLAISGMKNPRMAMLERELIFKQSLILTISTNIITILTSFAIAFVYRTYWAIVVGGVLGQVVQVAASYWIAPYRPRLHWSRARELWRFSLWLTLSELVATLNYRADQLIVGGLLGKIELGFYTVGGRIAQTPGREVVAPLTATLFPAFSLIRDDPARLRQSYVRAQTLVTFVALPVTVMVAVFAAPTVAFLMTERWRGAVFVIQTVAVSTAFETLGSLVTPLAMAVGQTQIVFRRNVLKFMLRIPMILGGLLAGGLVGLLIGRSIAGILGVLIDMVQVRKIAGLGIVRQLNVNARCFCAATVMAVCGLALQEVIPPGTDAVWQFFRLAVLGVSSGVVFILTAALLWRQAGCPDGAERDVGGLVRKLSRRLSRSRGAMLKT